MATKKGILFVISGPSGVGKTTLVNALLEKIPRAELVRAVTATTRKPRENEANGEHYFFLKKDEFQKKIANNEFLEYAFVHEKDYYGSLKMPIIDNVSKGINVVLTIDVQGFTQIHPEDLGIKIVSIFINPKDIETLRSRLVSRGTENESEIENRLFTAKQEIILAKMYNYVIVSGTRDEDFFEIFTIYTKENKSL